MSLTERCQQVDYRSSKGGVRSYTGIRDETYRFDSLLVNFELNTHSGAFNFDLFCVAHGLLQATTRQGPPFLNQRFDTLCCGALLHSNRRQVLRGGGELSGQGVLVFICLWFGFYGH